MTGNLDLYGKLWRGGCLFKTVKFGIIMSILSTFWIGISWRLILQITIKFGEVLNVHQHLRLKTPELCISNHYFMLFLFLINGVLSDISVANVELTKTFKIELFGWSVNGV